MCGIAERPLAALRPPRGRPSKLDDYAASLRNKSKECAMKLNSAQVEQTLSQFEAQVIPDDHPIVPQLSDLFGDHTFFLNSDGLNVVEPNETGARAGTVVNLANWTDAHLTSLAPHEPEPTEIIVVLETEY
jgi:hypothetical protein